MAKSIERELAESVVPEQMMQEVQLEPGKHYRGTFWVNEYGVVTVKPEQKGSNPQGLSKLTEGDNWVIYTSKNVVRIVVSLPRIDMVEIKRMFIEASTRILTNMLLYNLEKTRQPKNKRK